MGTLDLVTKTKLFPLVSKDVDTITANVHPGNLMKLSKPTDFLSSLSPSLSILVS